MAHHFRPNRTLICSVVFIDIAGYTKKSFNEQVLIKECFNAHLADAIKNIALSERMVLDTGDGAAIGCIGDPEDALTIAMNIRGALDTDDSPVAAGLQVRIGINLGPVRILKDINNQMNMIGDGINAAERIMSFADPGQLLVSRSYYDMLSSLSQEYAELFQYQGSRADKHVREHDIYAVEREGVIIDPAAGRSNIEETSAAGEDNVSGQEEAPRKLSGSNMSVQSGKSAHPRKAIKIALAAGAAVATIAVTVILISDYTVPPKLARLSRESTRIVSTFISERLDAIPDRTPTPAADSVKASTQSGQPAPAVLPLPTHRLAPERVTDPTTSPSVSIVIADREEAASKAVNAIAPPVKQAVKRVSERTDKSFKTVSSRAGDILFTVTGMQSTGNEVTVRVQTYNGSKTSKRIALYDSTYWWAKSQITDGAGDKHDVNKVSFLSGDEKISMSLTGTEGVPIDPQKTVTAVMTFRKARKGIKTLVLHPFIYQGEHQSEHQLVMKLGG